MLCYVMLKSLNMEEWSKQKSGAVSMSFCPICIPHVQHLLENTEIKKKKKKKKIKKKKYIYIYI